MSTGDSEIAPPWKTFALHYLLMAAGDSEIDLPQKTTWLEPILSYPLPMSANELLKRITSAPDICHGKPCIRGLRYPVEWLLELLSGPTSEAEILADYPDLEPDDLRAAHAYAARLARIKRFETLPAA